MTAVPNWIAKGYVYVRPRGLGPGRVYPITSWRATTTQVIVTAEGMRGEARFRLDRLREVGQRDNPLTLVAPTDERVAEVQRAITVNNAVGTLKAAMDERIQADMGVEELVLTIGRVQRAATKALAGLADLL
jgi:hypothetical protein